MKPLYVKKNGVVYKISGNGMPASYPGANVEYDNTVTSELQATDVQSAIDELSTREAGVQSDWNENDSTELDYIKNKPANLVQDASYVHTDNNYDATAKGKVDSLGTASTKDAGVANGVAELDSAGKVPSSQLPSFVDDVIEVADYDHLPITGESGKIYVTLDTNKTYRWSGSGYTEISASLTLGETSSTAYRGDRGKTAYDHATETKLSTATASGLYKVAATAQGHISSLTAVEKSDITALGIPGSDTNTKNTAYGTCDTAGDVKDKVATLVNATNWILEVGTIVGIRYTYTNTYSATGISLNVNNTGAKNIRYSDGIFSSGTDAKCPTAFGEAGQTIYYMYDGTYWVWVSHSKDNDTLYNFKGNEFRSADGNNYGQETGYGGNANYMVVNGHYYYNSNGPSTDIGASADDGAIYVQAFDEDNVTQIAQNYENGNIFVRSKVNGSWTEWKKTIANITANNTILTTDKTPFLTRQTLNLTGFSGYVREKLVGASYAWNQLVENGNFADTSGWTASGGTVSVASNTLTLTQTGSAGSTLLVEGNSIEIIQGHKYLMTIDVEVTNTASGTLWIGSSIGNSSYASYVSQSISNGKYSVRGIVSGKAVSSNVGIRILNTTAQIVAKFKNFTITDLTLAFGSTIADYLYGLSNNGGITKLRDMGCPIDTYTPYGYNLVSSKPSGKKIVGKNLVDLSNPELVANTATYSIDGDTVTYTATGTGYPRVVYDLTPFKKINNGVLFLKATASASGSNTYFRFQDGATSTIIKNISISGNTPQSYDDTVNISNFKEPKLIMYINASSSATVGQTLIVSDFIICYNSLTDKTYEHYWETNYSLGNDELRGKFDLVNGEIVASGDVKESNGDVTRKYGIVDLGTVTYSEFSALIVQGIFPFEISGRKQGGEIIAAKYSIKAHSSTWDLDNNLEIVTLDSYSVMRIRNTACTTAAQMQTANSGIYLIYELATPTTEQSTPFADPMSMVGATTEEYIDTRDIPCPVGAERQYMGQSEDVVEIPSMPQSDGKRVLISEVSGGKEQVYWDIPKLYYKEYVVYGDGTKTYGDLLTELKPYYEALSEDEKTYSKVMMRATSSGNECLTFVGNYWYSRMGVNDSGLWLDQIDFQYNKYFRQLSGGSITEYTNTNAAYNVFALRVLTYTRAES